MPQVQELCHMGMTSTRMKKSSLNVPKVMIMIKGRTRRLWTELMGSRRRMNSVQLWLSIAWSQSKPPKVKCRGWLYDWLAEKLVDNEGIDSPNIQTSLSDNYITLICDMIKRPGGLASERMPGSRSPILVLLAKNLKHTAFAFKMMEYLSKTE